MVEDAMRATIRKFDNHAAVRIPATVLQAAGFLPGQAVDFHAEDGRIVVAPAGAHGYALNGLLARITPDNRHAEADFGRPVGREGP
jgi:antitoxin MazE